MTFVMYKSIMPLITVFLPRLSCGVCHIVWWIVVYCFNIIIWPKIMEYCNPTLFLFLWIPLFPSLSWSFLLKLCAAMANSCVPSPETLRTLVTRTGQYYTHYTLYSHCAHNHSHPFLNTMRYNHSNIELSIILE